MATEFAVWINHADATYAGQAAWACFLLLQGLEAELSRFDPNKQNTYFIYGGGWMARFASPEGLEGNALYGFSTNQAIVNGSNRTALGADDMVFLRPTQSEVIMREFGDLLIVRGGRVIDRWPVFEE